MSNTWEGFKAYSERVNKEIQEKLAAAAQRAIEESVKEIMPIVKERMEESFKQAVQDFYDSYHPNYYDRHRSLFGILDISMEDEGVYGSIEGGLYAEKMTAFRSGYVGDGDLYDQVFRKGWHGGASKGPNHPSPGAPFWRTPYRKYDRWGSQAKVATPPKEAFIEDLQSIAREELSGKLTEILNEKLAARTKESLSGIVT